MVHCPKCKQRTSNEGNYCEHCGSVLKRETTPASHKRPVLSWQRFAIFALFLIVLAGSSHIWLKQQVDPTKQLATLNKAFLSKDMTTFLNGFTIPEGTEIDPKGFFTYLEEENWTDTLSLDVKRAMLNVQSSIYSAPIEDSKGNQLITVIDEPYFYFYKKIKLMLEPTEVMLSSLTPNVQAALNNKTAIPLEDTPRLIGRVLPGNHQITIQVTDDFETSTRENSVFIQGDGHNTFPLQLNYEETKLTVTSDYDDAIIWLNNTSTDKTPDQLQLYDLPMDGSIKLHAIKVIDGKESKSDVVAVTNNKVHLPFAEVQAQKQEEKAAEQVAQQAAQDQKALENFRSKYEQAARSLFYDFRRDFDLALYYANFGIVSDYFVSGSKAQTDHRAFVTDHNTFDYSYSYEFISNEILSVKATSKSSFDLTSYEIFNFYTSKGENWHYERQKKYTIRLVNNQLKIADIQNLEKDIKTRLY